MERIALPQSHFMISKIYVALCLLACSHVNATLYTKTMNATSAGCFSVWENQFTKLRFASYKPSNSVLFCGRYCLKKNPQTKFIFLRGMECQCALPDTSLKSKRVDDANCNYPCPGQAVDTCGGNRAFTVYCLSSSTSNSSNDCSQTKDKYPVTKLLGRIGAMRSRNRTKYPYPVRDSMPCGLSDICPPAKLLPTFDYFPLNSASECADYCGTDTPYVFWTAFGGVMMMRLATRYAILMWWKVPGSSVKLPICLCSDQETKEMFSQSDGYCGETCPGNAQDMCGGVDSKSIFGSVYCIENGSGRCSGKKSESKGESEPFTTGIKSTTESVFTMPVETDSTNVASDSTTSYSTTISTTTTTRRPYNAFRKRCRGEDRYGNTWEICSNFTASLPCEDLISGSDGTAFWKCNATGKFATWQPDVSQCKSRWVQKVEQELNDVTDIKTAYYLASNLTAGCTDKSHSGNNEYFGHEIASLADIINKTLCIVKGLNERPSQLEFENIIKTAVDLNACLITSYEPWKDLTLAEKSRLSTHLVEATEDVLFHFTQFVTLIRPKALFRKDFIPMKQFAAVAEAFHKLSNVSSNFYCDPDRTSCVRLPAGWMDLLPGNKVEIAIITISPESVEKVMSCHGAYEHKGPHEHKVFNGRMISFSVSSSSLASRSQKEACGARSKSLQFPKKGIEIIFHHIVDAYGKTAYDIRRKLHEGEKPKAVLGSVKCFFWDTNKHNWSTEGCHLVHSSRTETVCECSHLSSYAILMDVHRYIGKPLGLKILTLVLCPLSEVGLILTILVLSITKNCVYKTRSTICKHLSFCLFLGNGMILIVLDQNYVLNAGVCMGAAIAAHYIFLCAFMWMLLEGVQLYRMVIHVFDSGKSYMGHYGIIAYGSPLIVVAVTAGVGHLKRDKPYGGVTYCWLVESYIWAFMIPVAVVITSNLIILSIAMRTAYHLQHQEGEHEDKLSPAVVLEKIRFYRVCFKGCFSLTVLLGLTWVVGFFTLVEGHVKIVAAYLFTILNASQGFLIFLFTYRTYFHKGHLFRRGTITAYFPSFLWNSSTSHSPILTRMPFIISKGKLVLDNSE